MIELSKIKYGLFSVDEWKRLLARIITKKVEAFNLDGTNREKMRQEIRAFLYKAIGDFEDRYNDESSRTFGGFLEGMVARTFGIFNKLKREIPNFTEDILNFMNDPRNRLAIRQYIIDKIDNYANNTFAKIDYTVHDEIIVRHKAKDRDEAVALLTAKVESLDNRSQSYKITLTVLAIFTGLCLLHSKTLLKSEYLIITATCFAFLLTGLLLPMIEIDARIATMSFTLLGEPVSFHDQVLYYKSKSIFEVVQLMILQSRLDLLFVGLLVFTFSVLFPLSKLTASIIYIYFREWQSNKYVRFLVFKTGKWSMADVMVLAIFMAYIGFSGIITEQLKQIENITQNLDILTTNNSTLLAGFFAFTAFAILSLLVSHKLQYDFRRIKRAKNLHVEELLS